MAVNDTLALIANSWVQMTNANANSIRVQGLSGYSLLLLATAGATAPTSDAGAIVLAPGEVLAADLTIAQLWPGVAGANRVWAKASQASYVSRSHADA